MPLFTQPRPRPTRRQMDIWDQHVNSWGGGYEQWHGVDYLMSDPRALWGAYWDRFNMIRIPVFPKDEFFDMAIEVAKEAKSKEDFNKLMGEKNKQQLAELEALLKDAAHRIFYNEQDFPCKDAFNKTIQACHNPYFIYLIRLLKGSALGWEADVIRDQEPIDQAAIDPNDDYEDPNLKSQYVDFWDEEYDGDMEPVTYIPDENFTLPDATTNNSSSSAREKRKRVRFDDGGTGSEEEKHQEPENSSSDPALPNSSSLLQAINESTSKPDGVDGRRHKRQRLERSPEQASSPQPPTEARKSEKRTRHDDDEDVSRKRQRLESPTIMEAPASHASPREHATGSKVSKKRSRHDDENDHSTKRQKLETSAARTPNSDALPSPSAIGQKMSKRRSRQNDGGNGSQKRQKRETTVTSDTAPHLTSSQPAVNDRSGLGSKDSRQRGSQKRKTTSTNASRTKSAPTRLPNTRSRRRNGSATLWELDESGKAKLR